MLSIVLLAGSINSVSDLRAQGFSKVSDRQANELLLADDFSQPQLSPILSQWSELNLESSTTDKLEFREFLKSIPVKHSRISAATPLRPVRQLAPIVDNAVAPTAYVSPVVETKLTFEGDESDSGAESDRVEPSPVKSSKTFAVIEITAESLTRKIEEQKKLITENDALDEPAKTEQLEQLNAASIWVQKAKDFDVSIKQLQSLSDSFEEDLKSKTEELAQTADVRTPDKDATSDTLQSEVRKKRADIELFKGEFLENESQIEQREKRIEQIPTLKTAALERLKKVERDFLQLADKPDDIFKTFSTLALDAQKLATDKEIKALDIESRRQEEVSKLLPLERDLKARKISQLESEIKAWDVAFNKQREAEIAKQNKEAENAVALAIAADPELGRLAQANQKLAETRSTLATKIQVDREKLKDIKARVGELDSKFKTLKQKIEKGMTPANGALLIEHRQNLTQPVQSQVRIDQINKTLQEIRIKELSLKEQREPLASTENYVALLVSNGAVANNKVVEFERMAEELVGTQKAYLNDLDQDYSDYTRLLIDVSAVHASLISKINESREYIDRNAMWIRSSEPLWAGSSDPLMRSHFENTSIGLRRFFQPSAWVKVCEDIGIRVFKFPIGALVTLAVLFGVFVVNWRLREHHG